MANQLFSLAYISIQSSHYTPDLLADILQQARDINMERDITGLLLHKDDSFLQILEGPRNQVLRTYASICRDHRHHDVETLMMSDIADREFSDWRMGFTDISGIDTDTLSGYSDFLQAKSDSRKTLRELGKGERLALLFKNMGNTQ